MAAQTTPISELKSPKQFTNSSTTRTETTSLQGWKEIATYVKRGVRTVQRWERTAGLPVRRARPSHRSPVFAFPEELEHWLHSRPTRSPVDS
jgi:hypothetical protein